MDKVVHPEMRKWISNPISLGPTMEHVRQQLKEVNDYVQVKSAEAAAAYREREAKKKQPRRGPKMPKERPTGAIPSSSGQSKILAPNGKDVPVAIASSSKTVPLPVSSNKKGTAGQLKTPEENKYNLEYATNVINSLGGKEFFNVKTKSKPKRKRKKKGEPVEENDDEDELEASFAANVTVKEDQYESDNSGPVPSVKDYFSDFSDLSEDSEEEYDDFDDDAGLGHRVSQFERRMRSKYTHRTVSDSDDTEDEEDGGEEHLDKREEPQGVHEEEGEPRQRYEPNEEVDEGDQPSGSQPTPSKRSKLTVSPEKRKSATPSAPTANQSNTGGKAKDTASDGRDESAPTNEQPPNSSANAAAGPQPAFTRVGREEQFKAFMDRVYKTKLKRDNDFYADKSAEIRQIMNISEEEYKDLQRRTSISLVSVRGETFQEEPIVEGAVMPILAPPLPDSAKSKLQSLAIFVTHGDDPTGFQWRSNNVQQQINDDILNVAFMKRMAQQQKDYANKDKLHELVDKDKDFLIEISVYQAGDPDEALPDDVKSYVEPKLAFKLQLLGRQTLADLRDAMHCENDLMSMKEVEHPDELDIQPEDLAGNKFTAAALIIGDTIYSDMRKPDGYNYAPKINEWAAAPPKKNIGPFQEGDLVSTRLEDLTIRFGYPYVFMHMGNCEHIFVFNKAKLMEKKDEHRLDRYPIVIPSPAYRSIYCRVDNEHLATWAVLDYKEFPEDPMMVCTQCLKLYCYDGEGNKRGRFRVFPFRQLANEL